MPTHVETAWQRRDDAGQGATQADITVILLSLIACLTNLVLIAWSPTIAAAVATMGQY